MKSAEWIHHHRRSLLFLLVMVVLSGCFTYGHMRVSLFPMISFPRVSVTADSGDRTAEQMLVQVTQPLEEKLRQIPGVKSIRSTTSRGSAEISVAFDWGHDMSLAELSVRSTLAELLPELPPGTLLQSSRMDPTRFPVLAFSLNSGKLTTVEQRWIAKTRLLPLLAAVPGVAHIGIQGGDEPEFQVNLDPGRCLALGLSAQTIAESLQSNRLIRSIGRLEDHYKLYLGMVHQDVSSVDELKNIIISVHNVVPIHLSDVATVRMGTVPRWQRINADGKEAVLMLVYQQPDANSVELTRRINQTLHNHRTDLPADLSIHTWYQQSHLVEQSLLSVRDAMIIGMILAGVVLQLFLRNIRMTLIVILVVPSVLASTLLIMNILGMSLNIMTLGGIAAAVGLILDDAIVVIEQLATHRSQGKTDLQVAIDFLKPLAGSSVATLIIFLPLAFLSGVTGAFFKALAISMSISLIASFLISWLAIPLMAHTLLGIQGVHKAQPAWELRLIQAYQKLFRASIKRPSFTLLLVLPLLISGVLGYRYVDSGFMPAMDEGGFTLDYRTQPGTSLTETDRIVRQMERIIEANPNVASYSRRTGAQLGGWLTEANEGDLFIRLKSNHLDPVDDVMSQLRTRIQREVPGLHVEMAQLMEDLIGDLTAVPQPIELKIFGENPLILDHLAQLLTHRLRLVPHVVDINDGIHPAGDALQIIVDPVRASVLGLTISDVQKQLQMAIGGDTMLPVFANHRMISLRIWWDHRDSTSIDALSELPIMTPSGSFVALHRIAQLIPISGQNEISRQDLARMVAVTARIDQGNMGNILADVKRILRTPGLFPPGYYVQLGGLYAEQQKAFKGLLTVMLSGFALIFLLLLFLYEEFGRAIALLCIPLLSISSVFTGLWIAHAALNISSMMGMTMVVGIVTEVGIFYFSGMDTGTSTVPLDHILLKAGLERLRPILMTTLTAILTLLPLALALGEGAQMQQPLAIAIISGLVIQLPLALWVMPTFYFWLQRGRHATFARGR